MPRRNPRSRASKPAYHHGDLSNELVIAAQRLIEAGGSSRLTLRAAAQAAGVSAAAPYRHFADREAMLAAVLAQGFRELAQVTDAARRAAADPLSGLLAVGQAYVAFAAAHPAIYRLMFGPECDKASHPTLMAAGQEAFAILTQAVLDCRLAGVIDEADVQPVVVAAWSLSHGLASLHVDGLLAAVMPGDVHAIARSVMQTVVGAFRGAPSD